VEAILLRDIQLPLTLKTSIETKQQAEQEALAMNFRLQKETQEAQRKRIEAQGIRDFQQIVAQGISPQLLEWKGIEACTFRCAISNGPTHSLDNSESVVIGNLDLIADAWRKTVGRRDGRSKQPTTVQQSGIGGEQLDWTNLKVGALSDRVLRLPFTSKQSAWRFVLRIDPSLLAKPKISKRGIELIFGESFPEFGKVVVARVSDSFGSVQRCEILRVRTDHSKSIVPIFRPAERTRVLINETCT